MTLHPDAGATEDAFPGAIRLPGTRDTPACASAPSHRVVLVYSYPQGGVDRSATLADDIRSIIERMNYKLIQESKRSSEPSPFVAAQFRVSCTSSGAINVVAVQTHAHGTDANPSSPQNVRFSVEGHEAIGATPRHAWVAGAFGQGRPSGSASIKYLAFHDAPHPCRCNIFGVGYGWIGRSTDPGFFRKSSSDLLTNSNYNRVYTTVGIVFRENPGFVESWHSHTGMHELVHVMGGVQQFQGQPVNNPWATAAGHCTDGNDVECYNDGSASQNGTTYADTKCPNGRFNQSEYVPHDCRYDTYFDTEPEAGTILTSYWNVGGAENPFLHYSSSTIPPTP